MKIETCLEMKMQRKLISAVVQGDWIFVAGTTGYDYAAMTISGDVAEQAKQCFANIAWALEQAGSSMADVVRVHYILPDASDFEACWPVTRAAFEGIRPALCLPSFERFRAGSVSQAWDRDVRLARP